MFRSPAAILAASLFSFGALAQTPPSVPPIELPTHGGVLYVQGGSAHAYQFETLSSNEGERRFRLLVTPALTPHGAALREVRLDATTDGHFVIELVGDGGVTYELIPGDPELQVECRNGAVPTETRETTVTVTTIQAYFGLTSEALFETSAQ
jgi:hypothetical protein